MKKAYYSTMKKRIQKSMFLTSLIPLLLILAIIIPVSLAFSIPISNMISKTLSHNLVKLYESNVIITKEVLSEEQLNDYLESTTINDLIAQTTQKNMNLPTDQEEFIERLQDSLTTQESYIIINQLDEMEKKKLIYAMFGIMDTIHELLPFTEIMGDNIILMQLKSSDGDIYTIPQFKEDHFLNKSVSYFEKIDPLKSFLWQYIKEIYENTKESIIIYDRNAHQLGKITIVLNPLLLISMIVPYVLVFIIISILSVLLVYIMGKLMSRRLLKPLKSLNRNLSDLANENFDAVDTGKLEIKKPPQEIYELVENTNRLMEKMQSNYHVLESNKEELDSQYFELEAQNTELLESREKIRIQQDHLVQSEKMASIGQLSAAIAHEINTPMGVVKSNAQMATMFLDRIIDNPMLRDDPASIKQITKMKTLNQNTVTATDRVNEIIKSLKNFSRLDQSDFQVANIHEGINSVLTLSSHLWKNKITITQNYGDLPAIRCYPGLLNQVFMNIIVNGIHASENDGELIITTVSNDEEAMISVIIKDHGIGIPSDELDRIFDSGFTTKEIGMGSGLGLAISKDIIEKHGGDINVESQLAVGTAFTINIPYNLEVTDAL